MNTSTAEKTDHTQQQNFSADVSRLLDIVANALYTNHDVFLRELISNAADACDRLRYDAIQNPGLTQDNPDFKICIYKDTTARTLNLVDNGVGMTREELAENLGTIAKSGTAKIMESMKAEGGNTGADKLKLIGQFGVGFYAGFMVAHSIEVVSRRAGSDDIFCWTSDGKSGFTIEPASDIQSARLNGARGTAITLALKDEACEFLIDDQIVKTVEEYSDHIGVPIFLGAPKFVSEDKDAKPLNSASALWMRSPSDITKDEYTHFYTHIATTVDEPIMTSHWHAEGAIDFTGLLFIPTLRPWDLFDPSRKHFVKLYIRRVFITDQMDTLMYPWLRFVRGVIDSEDLPLNISRETLQYNMTVEKIKNAVARKILGDLYKLSQNDEPAFLTFWGQFGAAIKEGLYDAPDHRPALLKICRFFSSHDNGEKYTSLEDYESRMKDGQDKVYYISGASVDSLKNSPQLEGFRERGIEVLFFTDTIDDFWLQNVMDYKGKPFQSITKGDIDLSKFGEKAAEEKEEKPTHDDDQKIIALIEAMNVILESKVHKVRRSGRLKNSPVCLIAADQSVDMNMERVLKIHQKYDAQTKPVLEINIIHPLILKLADLQEQKKDIVDAAQLLYEQACVIQGIALEDPSGFSRRMSDFIQKGLSE